MDNDGLFDDAVSTAAIPPPMSWPTLVALGIDELANPLTQLPKHPIALRVTDPRGATDIDDTATMAIYRNLPDASFTVNSSPTPISGIQTKQDVAFVSTSSHGKPGVANVAFDWDFDYDGHVFEAMATGATTVSRFPVWGTYAVALRVTDENGRVGVAVGNVFVDGPGMPRVGTGP